MTTVIDECLDELDRALREHPRAVRLEHRARAHELLVETIGADDELGTTPRGWVQQYMVGADLGSIPAPGWLRLWRRRKRVIVGGSLFLVIAVITTTAYATYQPIVVSQDVVIAGDLTEAPSFPFDDAQRLGYRDGARVGVGFEVRNNGIVDVQLSVPAAPSCCFATRLVEVRTAPPNDCCRITSGVVVATPITIPSKSTMRLVLVYELVNCQHYEAGAAFGIDRVDFDLEVLGVHHDVVAALAAPLRFVMPKHETAACPAASVVLPD